MATCASIRPYAENDEFLWIWSGACGPHVMPPQPPHAHSARSVSSARSHLPRCVAVSCARRASTSRPSAWLRACSAELVPSSRLHLGYGQRGCPWQPWETVVPPQASSIWEVTRGGGGSGDGGLPLSKDLGDSAQGGCFSFAGRPASSDSASWTPTGRARAAGGIRTLGGCFLRTRRPLSAPIRPGCMCRWSGEGGVGGGGPLGGARAPAGDASYSEAAATLASLGPGRQWALSVAIPRLPQATPTGGPQAPGAAVGEARTSRLPLR